MAGLCQRLQMLGCGTMVHTPPAVNQGHGKVQTVRVVETILPLLAEDGDQVGSRLLSGGKGGGRSLTRTRGRTRDRCPNPLRVGGFVYQTAAFGRLLRPLVPDPYRGGGDGCGPRRGTPGEDHKGRT